MSRNPIESLNGIIENGLDDLLLDGIEYTCQLIENDAKKECAVDDGILRASISHYISPLLMGGFVGTNVEYAPYVHEGTGLYATNGNGRKEVPWRYKDAQGNWHTTKGQKPNPFMRKAVDRNRSKILNAFRTKCGVKNIRTRFDRRND